MCALRSVQAHCASRNHCSCRVPLTSRSSLCSFCTLCLQAVTLQLGPQGLTCSGSDDLPSRLILTYSHHPPLTRQQAWATSLSFPRCASLFYLQASLCCCGLLRVCLHQQARTRPVSYLYELSLSARGVRVQNCCVY